MPVFELEVNEEEGGERKGGSAVEVEREEAAEDDGNCPAQHDNEAFKKLFQFPSTNSYC